MAPPQAAISRHRPLGEALDWAKQGLRAVVHFATRRDSSGLSGESRYNLPRRVVSLRIHFPKLPCRWPIFVVRLS
jgi:hypothetical protein